MISSIEISISTDTRIVILISTGTTIEVLTNSIVITYGEVYLLTPPTLFRSEMVYVGSVSDY